MVNSDTVSFIWFFLVVIIFEMDQRAAIKFCFKCGKSGTETFSMMQLAYGKDCLSRSKVFELSLIHI